MERTIQVDVCCMNEFHSYPLMLYFFLTVFDYTRLNAAIAADQPKRSCSIRTRGPKVLALNMS